MDDFFRIFVVAMRFFAELSYLGTAYCGWQRQPDAPSVQGALENALSTILRTETLVTGAGRTDTGVHALHAVAHFDAASEPDLRNLNALLPRDIAVTGCEKAAGDFHARYSAKSKEYIYKIYNHPHPNPFYRGYSLHIERSLDAALMDEAAKAFLGRHDFSAFQASGSSVEDSVRTVFDAGVRRESDLILFTVRADGFLYNMVRIMVGTLLDVAYGKTGAEEIAHIIAGADRSCGGPTAPPHGLYLNRVMY